MFFTVPLPPSATPPLSKRARVILWMMDSATSPSASRRMTGGGGRHDVNSESSLTRETNRKEICCYVHWLGMMLSVLVKIVAMSKGI